MLATSQIFNDINRETLLEINKKKTLTNINHPNADKKM